MSRKSGISLVSLSKSIRYGFIISENAGTRDFYTAAFIIIMEILERSEKEAMSWAKTARQASVYEFQFSYDSY